MAAAVRLASVAMLSVAFLLLVAPVAISGGRTTGGYGGFRTTLIRTAESRNFSLAGERSRRRLSMYTSGAGVKAPVRSNVNGGDYIMQFGIGKQVVWAEADTGSDLVWVKCSPCTGCDRSPCTGCDPSTSPLYDPAQSSFTKLPCTSQLCLALGNFRSSESKQCTDAKECSYRYVYGISGDHYTQGVLGKETFTFGDGYATDVGFGCSDTISGSQFGRTSGLVGLGRGTLSLVSQLGAGRFAYCLSTNPDAESPILFGSLAVLDESAGEVFSTPLVKNPVADNHYYVNLTGITVGESTLSIEDGTFAIDVSGDGGVFFDSGTTLTFLKDAAYSLVRQAFVSQMQATYKQVDGSRYHGRDLCFQAETQPPAAVPTLALHFDGADMNLQRDNYFQSFADGVLCLEMGRSPGISIIGNMMQANFRVLHDVDSMLLSFQAAECGR